MLASERVILEDPSSSAAKVCNLAFVEISYKHAIHLFSASSSTPDAKSDTDGGYADVKATSSKSDSDTDE